VSAAKAAENKGPAEGSKHSHDRQYPGDARDSGALIPFDSGVLQPVNPRTERIPYAGV